MGAEERQQDANLSDPEVLHEQHVNELASSARQFNYYRLLYMLERVFPDAPPVGNLGPVRDERIRLRGDPSLVFNSSDVSEVNYRRMPDNEKRAQVSSSFLALYGSVSPLPPHYIEKIAQDEYRGDTQVTRELLDVIHHRLLSLVYRSWSKYRHSVGYISNGQDNFTKRLWCAVGIDGFNDKQHPLNPFYFLRFAPLLASKSRSARGLQVVLDELLGGIGVDIEQFVGHWTLIEKPLRNKIGVMNHQLGQNMVIGRYVYDGSGRYTVKLGPLEYNDYLSFLPGGHRRPFLQSVINTFTPGIHDVMLELQVDLDAAPRFQLGSPRASTLSRTAWLGGSGAQSFNITVPLEDRPKSDEDEDEDDRGEPPPLPGS